MYQYFNISQEYIAIPGINGSKLWPPTLLVWEIFYLLMSSQFPVFSEMETNILNYEDIFLANHVMKHEPCTCLVTPIVYRMYCLFFRGLLHYIQ